MVQRHETVARSCDEIAGLPAVREYLVLDRLTEAEKERYREGDWLVAHPVRSEQLEHLRRGPDLNEDAAAELAARVKVVLDATRP